MSIIDTMVTYIYMLVSKSIRYVDTIAYPSHIFQLYTTYHIQIAQMPLCICYQRGKRKRKVEPCIPMPNTKINQQITNLVLQKVIKQAFRLYENYSYISKLVPTFQRFIGMNWNKLLDFFLGEYIFENHYLSISFHF